MKKLLTLDTRRIGQPDVDPVNGTHFPDHFPESLAGGTPEPLRQDLEELLGKKQVLARASDLVRFSSDGSPYRLFPQVVVRPRDAADVAKLFAYATENDRTLTFRSGASSLCGQSQSDDILVDVRHHFMGMAVEGEQLRVRPGEALVGVNNVLSRHGRVLGPDPASYLVATIGGILANNAGGMRATLERDSYHTLRHATIVLPTGTVVNTEDPDAEEKFAAAEPAIAEGLAAIREEILADTQLTDRIRRKYAIRNTTGLRMDAFLDGQTPVEILRRLMVGSEGILGFIAEAVIDTLPLKTTKAVAWVMFETLGDAADAVAPLVAAGAEAVELLVSPVLRSSVGNFQGARDDWAELGDDEAALLLEVAGVDEDEVSHKVAAAQQILGKEVDFMYEPADQANAWEIRSGLMPILGELRPPGTPLLTEDVCFPPERIGEASKDLMALLEEYDYPPSVMGHAGHGNLHFFMTPSFDSTEAVKRYAGFIDALAELVVDKYDGSLKGEHGTGLNMAPYVRREWGDQAYDLMWRVKRLLDPAGILAPDVQLTDNPDIHLENFKSTPTIEAIANSCTECGFCETSCPSRHVTTTPRQRIVLRREMARQPAASEMLTALLDEYGYDAIDMCAVDSSCATVCPLRIDTGKMMQLFRSMQQTKMRERAALLVAKNWAGVERAARIGLSVTDMATGILGDKAGGGLLTAVTDLLRSVISHDVMYSAEDGLPPAAGDLPDTSADDAAAIYFPACINRMFGRGGDGPSLPHTLVEVSRRAGQPLHIPQVSGLCCGTPFGSKGFNDARDFKRRELTDQLLAWSDGGRLPIVVDASSCTHAIVADLSEELTVIDATTWAAEHLVPSLTVTAPAGRVAVHPTCSSNQLGTTPALLAVANFVGDAFVPVGAGCCGSAGDRGLLHPELLKAATRDEVAGLQAAEDKHQVDAYVSANRTCEMGMTQVSGRNFEHIAYVLEQSTR